jgi:hypothetical protein
MNLLVFDSIILVAVLILVTVVVHFELSTNSVLCKFRADLAQRVDSSRKFTDRNKGDLVFGHVRITRAELLIQLKGQEATLQSLSGLNC